MRRLRGSGRRHRLLGGQCVDLVLQLLHLLLHDAHLILQCLRLGIVRKDDAIEGDSWRRMPQAPPA